MKITRSEIDAIEDEVENYGVKEAASYFQKLVADDLWASESVQSDKQFTRELQEHGTKIALENFQWQIAAKLLKDIGVKNIKTSYQKS